MKKSLRICVILFVITLLMFSSVALTQDASKGTGSSTVGTPAISDGGTPAVSLGTPAGTTPPAPLEPTEVGTETEGTLNKGLIGEKAEEAGEQLQKQVREIVPDSWHNVGWILPFYEWLVLAILVAVAFAIAKLTRMLLTIVIERGFKKRNFVPKEVSAEWLAKPASYFVLAVCLVTAMAAVSFPEKMAVFLYQSVRLFAIFCATWQCLRLTEVITRYALQRSQRHQANYYAVIIPLLSRTTKILLVCLGAIWCARALSLPVTALLGGLGIGGMAIAFAAKDAIANVFGSFTVIADRPFEVGDWIISNQCEGTVETVGIRSTRIRTFDHSVITIPNNLLVTTVVNNMGKRRFRRHKTAISLTYSTSPAKVKAFCIAVEKIITEHPATSNDMPIQVAFFEITPYSLNILVNYFLRVPGRAEELVARQEVLLAVMETASEMGVRFAYPTQSIEVSQE